jgi:hypothetical protein
MSIVKTSSEASSEARDSARSVSELSNSNLPPLLPESLLRRRECAAALTAMGFPISPATLASLATRGGGPPFRRFSRYVIYRWDEVLEWAQGRTTKAVGSTSELPYMGGRKRAA